MTMGHRKDIFRYRIITNLNCNMNESTGPNGNCYFCYQKMKAPLTLDIDKCRDTMRKIGVLKRATIMGGEAMLNRQLTDFIRLTREHVTNDVCLVTNGILMNEQRARQMAEAGLTEVAISVSSLEQYQRRREAALACKSVIWNTRINIPKCRESTGDKLVELLENVLTDGREDQGRWLRILRLYVERPPVRCLRQLFQVQRLRHHHHTAGQLLQLGEVLRQGGEHGTIEKGKHL